MSKSPDKPYHRDPDRSSRHSGVGSKPESELPAIVRIIRQAQAGSVTSKRKPSLPKMPWEDKDLS